MAGVPSGGVDRRGRGWAPNLFLKRSASGAPLLDTRQSIRDDKSLTTSSGKLGAFWERAPSQDLHPTLAELQAFDSGQLPAAERGSIERHLEGCAACCGALDTLPEGALEALLRAF